MNFYKRSYSSCDLSTLKLNIIENLLDQNIPKIKSSKSTIFQKENDTKSSTDICNSKLQAIEDSVNLYPNVDTSVWMRSCEQEMIEPITGKISGSIPDWLKGSLLRNGPGSLKVGEYRFDHLFDGSALLHRFEISNGNVTYQSRFIQTNIYKKNHAAKRIVITEFGTKAVPDPCQSIFKRVSAVFNPTENMTDNSNISIYPFGDEYYTFTEAPVIHRIDPKSLETLRRVNVADFVNIVSHTSHPHVMNDGTVYNLGMSITKTGPAYNIIKFAPTISTDNRGKKRKLIMFEQAEIVSTIPSRWILNPSYMHTFGITQNYFIIVEQPLAVALTSTVACYIKNKPMCSSLKWHENENTHIHLISRETGKVVKTFVAEAFFYLHIINQYETRDGNYVVLDLCCYRDAKMLDCMYFDAMQNMQQNPDYSKLFRGRPLRYILPLNKPAPNISPDVNLVNISNAYQRSDTFNDRLNDKKLMKKRKELDENKNSSKHDSSKNENLLQKKAAAFLLPNGNIFVKPELLCDLGCETPRINNDSNLGKEYRYFYAISSDVDIENPGSVIKVDAKHKLKKVWYEKGVYPSEPIFVPHPNGKNEDDGVVLSALVWGQERETEVGLLVLNAATFEEIARVTFNTPGPVPKCLHGWFSSVTS